MISFFQLKEVVQLSVFIKKFIIIEEENIPFIKVEGKTKEAEFLLYFRIEQEKSVYFKPYKPSRELFLEREHIRFFDDKDYSYHPYLNSVMRFSVLKQVLEKLNENYSYKVPDELLRESLFDNTVVEKPKNDDDNKKSNHHFL